MALAFRHDQSGLVLAEETADEVRLGRALKEIDQRLVLQKERAAVEGGWHYRVLRLVSDDQPPTLIVGWTDDYGNPLPLTWGLIDRVHKHLLGFRGNDYYVDPDEHNRRRQERLERDLAADLEAIADEHRPRLSGRLSVSMSGRLHRKQRDPTPDAPRAQEKNWRWRS